MLQKRLLALSFFSLLGLLFSVGCQNGKLILPPSQIPPLATAIATTYPSLTATPNFHYKMEWGGYPPPAPMVFISGLALDASGDLYVANGNNVLKYDGNGNYIGSFGSLGTGNGQFYQAFSVDVDGSGDIYVADEAQARVQKFDSTWNYLSQFSVGGSGYQTSVVKVDNTGNVYVLNGYGSGPCFAQKYQPNGVLLKQWGGPGTASGQFHYPYSMTLDPIGKFVYVGDLGRIQKFDSQGNFISQWNVVTPGESPLALATDPLGNVYSAEGVCVVVYDANGKFLFQFGSPATAGNYTGPTFALDTIGLAVNPVTGDVYVTNSFWPGGYIEKWGY